MKTKAPVKYLSNEMQSDNPAAAVHSFRLFKALLALARNLDERTLIVRDEVAARWAGCKLHDLRACQYRLVLAGLMKVRQGNVTGRYHLYSYFEDGIGQQS